MTKPEAWADLKQDRLYNTAFILCLIFLKVVKYIFNYVLLYFPLSRFLNAEMRQSKEWDVLVTHFLGVDHAGHKYGPNHPEMGRKLAEMNAVIEATIKILPRDAVLFGKKRIQIHWIWILIQDFGLIWIRIQGTVFFIKKIMAAEEILICRISAWVLMVHFWLQSYTFCL